MTKWGPSKMSSLSWSKTHVLTKIEVQDLKNTHVQIEIDLSPFSLTPCPLSPSLSVSLSISPSLVRWHPVCSVTLSCHLPLPASHLCPLLGQPRHGTQTPSQPLLLRWHESWQHWTSLSTLSLIHFNFSTCNYMLFCLIFSLLIFLYWQFIKMAPAGMSQRRVIFSYWWKKKTR